VTLRLKILLYLIALHLIFASLAVALLWQERAYLLIVEPVFIASFVAGLILLRRIFGPLELIRSGTQSVAEGDFNTRLLPAGEPEIDALTGVYNQMIDRLREERIRVAEQRSLLTDLMLASPAGIVVFDFDHRMAQMNGAARRILDLAGPVGAEAAAPAPAESERLDRWADEGFALSEGIGAQVPASALPLGPGIEALEPGQSATLTLRGNRRAKVHKAEFMDRGFRRQFLIIEELTDELRRSERAAYERIIRMMSHEINNSIGASNSLLDSCLNYASQLREPDREDFTSALRVAMSRAHHLNGFVKSYADVVRLPKPDLKLCEPREILEDIARLMHPAAEARGIDFAYLVDGPPRPVPMDRKQMEQALVNIIKNAMDAIGDKPGAVTVRLNSGGVVIEDTGCGLTPEVREHLFTPFFTTKEKGRGIGLTLVQEILMAHGFDYSLDSTPDEPTRFTIDFRAR
jgi:two-component system nitrogen regulation sensor histidine kinase NtrY